MYNKRVDWVGYDWLSERCDTCACGREAPQSPHLGADFEKKPQCKLYDLTYMI